MRHYEERSNLNKGIAAHAVSPPWRVSGGLNALSKDEDKTHLEVCEPSSVRTGSTEIEEIIKADKQKI